jgi:hypothetical protein
LLSQIKEVSHDRCGEYQFVALPLYNMASAEVADYFGDAMPSLLTCREHLEFNSSQFVRAISEKVGASFDGLNNRTARLPFLFRGVERIPE